MSFLSFDREPDYDMSYYSKTPAETRPDAVRTSNPFGYFWKNVEDYCRICLKFLLPYKIERINVSTPRYVFTGEYPPLHLIDKWCMDCFHAYLAKAIDETTPFPEEIIEMIINYAINKDDRRWQPIPDGWDWGTPHDT